MMQHRLNTCVPLSTNLTRVLEAVHVGYVIVRDNLVICHHVFRKHAGTPRFKCFERLVGADKRLGNHIDRRVALI